MSERTHKETDPSPAVMDADINGHLATALFAGVILLILIVVYAMATAA